MKLNSVHKADSILQSLMRVSVKGVFQRFEQLGIRFVEQYSLPVRFLAGRIIRQLGIRNHWPNTFGIKAYLGTIEVVAAVARLLRVNHNYHQ